MIARGKHWLGRAFARTIEPAVGGGAETVRRCVDLVDMATQHYRLTKDYANPSVMPGAWDAWAKNHKQRVEETESRIRDYVGGFKTDAGPVRVIFLGDPRGATVKLEFPKPYAYLHDNPQGLCVPHTGR